MNTPANPAKAWHQEPMAVLAFALPGLAVIASFITLWIALTHVDALVASDYYQQGLGINRSMARDRAAIRAGLSASVEFRAESVTVRMAGCETAQ